MHYMGDLDFWDKKFRDRGDTIMKPEEALVSSVSLLKEGSVLDVACGDGRNSLYLLSEGFEVTGVDFSPEALKRLAHFAEQNNYAIRTFQMDLSEPHWIDKLDTFDNIIICHYRLHPEQLAKLHAHLSTDGVLFVTGFGHRHVADTRIRKTDLIMPEDFQALGKHFRQIEYREFEDERGFFVTYAFKRK